MPAAPVIAAVAAVASAGAAIYTGVEQKKAAGRAADQAERNAARQAKQAEDQAKAAEESTNRANQKRPDTSAILDAASQSGKAGASGTMLTGSMGVDPAALQLGKSTLLGQ